MTVCHMRPAFHSTDDLRYNVINVAQMKFHRRIIDLYIHVTRYVMAPCSYDAVIIRPAPLAEKIAETIDVDRYMLFFRISFYKLFTVSFALSVIIVQFRLNRRTYKDRRFIFPFRQIYTKLFRKVCIPLIKFTYVHRSVDSG